METKDQIINELVEALKECYNLLRELGRKNGNVANKALKAIKKATE